MVKSQKNVSTQTGQEANTDKKKRIGKKVKTYFGSAIPRIQKRINSDMRMSTKALITIDGILTELISKSCEVLNELTRKSGRKTVVDNDVKAAVKLMCNDGELSKHIILEGSKAVMKLKKN